MSVDGEPHRRFTRRQLINVGLRLTGLGAVGGAVALAVRLQRSGPENPSPDVIVPTPVPPTTEQLIPSVAPIINNRSGYIDGQMGAMPTLVHPLDDHYRDTVDRLDGTNEITGVFPDTLFRFSDEIKKYRLAPVVFLNENSSQRIKAGIVYISRVFALLTDRPDLRGPGLQQLGISVPNNLPLIFPQDATLYEVLADFLNAYAHRRVDFNPNPNRTRDYLLGTIGNPSFVDDRWQIKSLTGLSMSLIDERASREEYNTAYYQTTNVQFALRQLHEHIHFKQDEALMLEILKDPILVGQIGQDSWKMRQAIEKKALEHRARIARQNGFPNNIQFNEAQANAISQLLLFTLTKINRTDRFPGAEGDDPYPIDNASLQRDFRKNVLDGNALNLVWQLRHLG